MGILRIVVNATWEDEQNRPLGRSTTFRGRNIEGVLQQVRVWAARHRIPAKEQQGPFTRLRQFVTGRRFK